MNSEIQSKLLLAERRGEEEELGLHLGHHDYSHHPLQSQYTSQISEVGSPIVSSTSNQEQESAMREVANSNNIGSIITMLIDEQQVNIEDILTEEQYRQECQQQIQTKIKEEVDPTLSEFGTNSYQDYSFSAQQNFSRESPQNVWSGTLSTLHTDQQPQDVHGVIEKNLLSVPSVTPSRGMPSLTENTALRDDKYWERRRKNNLAAKKSRDTRRMRENQLRLRVLFLENANKVLREEMERKDVESEKLRERLSLYEGTENNCHNIK